MPDLLDLAGGRSQIVLLLRVDDPLRQRLDTGWHIGSDLGVVAEISYGI